MGPRKISEGESIFHRGAPRCRGGRGKRGKNPYVEDQGAAPHCPDWHEKKAKESQEGTRKVRGEKGGPLSPEKSAPNPREASGK